MIAKIWRGRQQASILRRMDVNIVNHPIEAGLGWAGLGWWSVVVVEVLRDDGGWRGHTGHY